MQLPSIHRVRSSAPHWIQQSRRLASPQLTTDQSQLSQGESGGILRSLYEAPPRIDDFNASQSSETQFITRVTNGTLQTEEGSPHVLYYEIHHRIPVDHLINESPTYETNIADLSARRGLTGLVLHGGPGAGCFPRHANFFSPEFYEYVVLLDQRGCGKSTPLGEVSNNTLPLLVRDVERLRHHLLEDAAWDCILGGSWGCTLALAYAHSYPALVRSMVLRGVCLFRFQEIDWLFGDPPSQDDSLLLTSNLRDLVDGAKSTRVKSTDTPGPMRACQLFSDGWKEFEKGINLSSSSNYQSTYEGNRKALSQYYHRLLGHDPVIRAQAARSWFRWEMGIYSSGLPSEKSSSNTTNTTLLVWDPARQIWHYEDAMVYHNQSVVSVNSHRTINGKDAETNKLINIEVIQSLRQCSQSRYQTGKDGRERIEPGTIIKPLSIKNITETRETTSQSMNSDKSSKGGSTNANFDPTAFIPAQAMITCYYSINDEYVIGRYREFLSLSSQNAPWYTSKLPPSANNILQTANTHSTVAKPLPPCIAIQGGRDAICPPDTALDLHQAWKELELRIALSSGHSMYDHVIAGEIVKALDRFGFAIMNEQPEKS